jgi:hypothetical protein
LFHAANESGDEVVSLGRAGFIGLLETVTQGLLFGQGGLTVRAGGYVVGNLLGPVFG